MSSGGRGRGGKFSKPKRGGSRHFSQRTNADGELENMWAARDPEGGEEESTDEEDEEDEDSDEESDEEKQPQQAEQSREQRKAAAKARKEAAIARQKAKAAQPGDLPPSESEEEDEDMPANPNHTAKARSQASNPTEGADAAPSSSKDTSQLSRREREAIQTQQAKERYQKLHAEGKTDEARADLARLKLIREKREADAARRAAEAEEKVAEAKAKAESRSGKSSQAVEDKRREAALGKSGKKKK